MSETIEVRTALTVLPTASLPTILAADDKDILGGLAKNLAGYEPDASTPAGRTKINSVKRLIGAAKMDFFRLADTLMEDAKKTIDGVRSERKIIEDRMDAMRDQIGRPLVEYQARENARIEAHEVALAAIPESEGYGQTETATELRVRLDYLDRYPHRDWEEFKSRAQKALQAEIDRTARLLAAAEKREVETAELERLRAEEAERQRLEAVEAQRVREERIAAEAAEAAKATAEAEAERREREAEERASATLLAAREAAEAERTAAAVREREVAEALARAETERLASEERARLLEERERLVAEENEKRRLAAAELAEQQRIAAIEAERQSVAREAAKQRAEDDRRAANKAHRASINREVLADLVEAINDNQGGELSEEKTVDVAKAVIVAVALGKVRHVRVEY